jgi:nucleoprotein TPR
MQIASRYSRSNRRSCDLYERFTAVDIECNRVTEDLVVANGKMDQLRNECANLRAEKRIWEDKALSMGRSHLSDLMANVQKMHDDIERSSENDRRRLESQIQLEHQRFVAV